MPTPMSTKQLWARALAEEIVDAVRPLTGTTGGGDAHIAAVAVTLDAFLRRRFPGILPSILAHLSGRVMATDERIGIDVDQIAEVVFRTATVGRCSDCAHLTQRPLPDDPSVDVAGPCTRLGMIPPALDFGCTLYTPSEAPR